MFTRRELTFDCQLSGILGGSAGIAAGPGHARSRAVVMGPAAIRMLFEDPAIVAEAEPDRSKPWLDISITSRDTT